MHANCGCDPIHTNNIMQLHNNSSTHRNTLTINNGIGVAFKNTSFNSLSNVELNLIPINYEGIQADIFDHILAILPEFDLSVFQLATGHDFSKLLHPSSD